MTPFRGTVALKIRRAQPFHPMPVRHSWSIVLLLSFSSLSCHSEENPPSLVRLEPSAVGLHELPRPVTLVGKNLGGSVSVSLNDKQRARAVPPQAWVGDQPLELMAQPNADELVVLLPADISTGRHDITVVIHGQHLALNAGLQVMGVSAGRHDAGQTQFDAGLSLTNPDAALGNTSNGNTSGSNELTVDAATPPWSGDSSTDTTSTKEPSGSSSGADTRDASVILDASVPHDGGLPDTTALDAALPFDAGTTFPIGDAGDDLDADIIVAPVPDADVDVTTPEDTVEYPPLRCAAGEFGPPEVVNIQGYNSGKIWSPTLTADALTLYFTDGSDGSGKIMKATRTTRNRAFTGTVEVPRFFPEHAIGTPYVVPSGLAMYFYSIQPTGLGSRDLYVGTRASRNDNFGTPTSLLALNTTSLEHLPWVSPNELWIVWVSQRDGLSSYWMASRPDKSSDFSDVRRLTSISIPGKDGRLFGTHDGLRVYFVSDTRPGGAGQQDIWYATRSNVNEEFSKITNLRHINTPENETDVTLTHDAEELFFVRTGPAGNQLHRIVANCNK